MQPKLVWKCTCHSGILEFSFWDHGLDWEGDSGEVEVSTDQFFADELDHFLAN